MELCWKPQQTGCQANAVTRDTGFITVPLHQGKNRFKYVLKSRNWFLFGEENWKKLCLQANSNSNARQNFVHNFLELNTNFWDTG